VHKRRRPSDYLSDNCRRAASTLGVFAANVCFSKSERKSRDVNTNSRFNPVSKTPGDTGVDD